MTSLDQWTTSQKSEPKPVEFSDEYVDYLYENSYERQIEKEYDYLIQEKLAEEKAMEIKEKESHARYVKSNYVRVGA